MLCLQCHGTVHLRFLWGMFKDRQIQAHALSTFPFSMGVRERGCDTANCMNRTKRGLQAVWCLDHLLNAAYAVLCVGAPPCRWMDKFDRSVLTACALLGACFCVKGTPAWAQHLGIHFFYWSIKNLTRNSQPSPLGAFAKTCIWEVTIPGCASKQQIPNISEIPIQLLGQFCLYCHVSARKRKLVTRK